MINSILQEESIHIWYATLNHLTMEFSKGLLNTLSSQELTKLNSFLYAKDKDIYGLSHTMLRYILANYLNISPSKVKFKTNVFGKPYLENDEFYFNMSHTEKHIAIALSHVEIGIDIEIQRPINNLEEISKLVFTNYELKLIQNTLAQEQQNIFYNLWTRKEAFVKALGLGLSIAQYNDISQAIHKTWDPFTQKSNAWKIESLSFLNPHCSASVAYLVDPTTTINEKIYLRFEDIIKALA